jgi:predicted transporter
VHEATGLSLSAWESFYVIVGSSAAALIGLQFVVIALLAETRKHSSPKEIDAFATPTILHFGAALLVSSILSAPWPSLLGAAVAIGICGFVGVGYVAIVIRRARMQTGYQMVLEDWVWHVTLPLIAYAALAAAALTLLRHVLISLFVVAATALLFLFIGIHNAWDTVTYIAMDHVQSPDVPAGSK